MTRRPLTLLSMALAASMLAGVACSGDDKNDNGSAGVSGLPTQSAGSAGGSGSGSAGTQAPGGSGTPGTTASGFPEPQEGVLLERLVVPAAQVNHPVESKGLTARGEMELPDGKDGIAWYDFTAFPGYGSNAVFSGHLDWFTGELGVFGRMRNLKEGDEAQIMLSDGMVMTYRVTSIQNYKVQEAPIAEIVGPTSKDTLTFITCDGEFQRSAQDYTHRRIIRAERVS